MEKRFSNYFTLWFIAFVLMVSNIWGISIFSLDEAKNASCAREMLERGDLIVPTFNYELRTDKPPLHYYFMMIAYKLFGVNEFSARFFSSLFGSFTVLVTFLFAKRVFDEKIALLSYLVLLSSLHFVFQFHMAVPDPFLIFFITSAVFSFYIFYKEGKKIFLWLFYICLGFGILSKGLVAIVLPTFTVLVFLALRRELGFLKSMSISKGLLITILISLPWYIAVGIKTDWIWVKEFLLKHNISRFSDSMEGHGGIFLITFLFVIIGMLPFSIFLPQTVKEVLKNKTNPAVLFLSLFVFIYTLFFSISKTKLPNYTVVVYPSLAVLIGITLTKLKIYKYFYSLLFYFILTLIIPIALYFILKNDENLYLVAQHSFFFFILTVGAFLSLIFYKNIKKVIISLSLSSILMTLVFFFILMPRIDKESSVKVILPYIDKDLPIGYYKRYNPAFSFYLKKRIVKLESPQEVEEFIKQGKVNILTREEFLEELRDVKGLKVVVKKKDLFENPTSVLLKNF
ncbi:putative dolichyl-phosphate-mannose-protein mannosyltransferase family protein [Sulfurihydrogenibium azorense Az-Fu1]|uniref:Putative dolichyl-phosphate-mannose-protein mannosyltransferase family protein n=1 Tax=Sulfurihydrogenibium azorense (strain DSM 15241 / OCM 825 / Az-Fu1) TaxID=204536 RepID=C1DTV3_SULAA|nr:glycosyltransferase family 39 protein [Sulfurihydrogenibium azorense]ACN99003.1 putative dolichyl-phosphate-mannose-protein mannosyltransferase family protein [Sulfurihydrogenibium azorense Az-Fu1]MDM7273026.1 glycosyltransferase family 39 protein [Sulfurihydrogenibium azorense]